MEFDFSIESSIEKIHNVKSKQYFQEVYQTFINKNYRSATVMLYSVLICDLVFKLRDLRDIYSDSKAEKILNEIEKMQEANPNSPEWESKLVELIKSRTNLLESSDIVAIESLQKFRHLSAHPILNNSDLLYSPNKETVHSLIRNILDGILTNPPFFSNKIFDTMVTDILNVKETISEYDALEKYIVSRYINRLKNNDFHKLFRSIWKIVYISTDESAIENMNIMYKVLFVFTTQRKNYCIELVRNESDFYSNIVKEEKVTSLINYLAMYPDIYENLQEPLQLLIKEQAKDKSEQEFIAWFLNDNFREHFHKLSTSSISKLSENIIKYMETICKNNGAITYFIDYLIIFFYESSSFEQSTTRLKLIEDYLKRHLTFNQVKTLLNYSNQNSQIFGSWYVPEKLIVIVSDFDDAITKEKYENIYK